VNLYNNTKKYFLNIGLLKHGFLVTASRLLKEMCEVSTFHTGTAEDRLMEPYFCPKLLAGVVYLDFLRNLPPELLHDVPLQTRIHLWFMHDAVQPHFFLAVREVLSYVCPEQWIRQIGRTAWPARAPDLNPLHIFISGDIRSLPLMLQDLQQRIQNGFNLLKPNDIYIYIYVVPQR